MDMVPDFELQWVSRQIEEEQTRRKDETMNTVRVTGLPWEVSEEHVASFLEVMDQHQHHQHHDQHHRPTGVGYVLFKNEAAVEDFLRPYLRRTPYMTFWGTQRLTSVAVRRKEIRKYQIVMYYDNSKKRKIDSNSPRPSKSARIVGLVDSRLSL